MLSTDERMPLIRFVNDAVVDGIATQESGRQQYMNVIHVYERSPGDIKCEFKDVAEKTAYDVTQADVMSTKEHKEWDEETGEFKTTKVKIPEKKNFYNPRTVTPWLDKKKEMLKNGKCTQAYYDYCVDSFDRFKKQQDQPINGTPLDMWSGAPLHVVKRAKEVGILSIEDAAKMSTDAMQAIGMGAANLKNLAEAFLAADHDFRS